MNILEAYNLWSQIYDTNRNLTRDLDLIVSKTILSNFYFKNILEIGCGTGKNTEWLIDISTHVLSIDFSEKMLEIARKKIKTEQVKFLQFDICKNWNFSKDKFDLISFNLVLEHFENLEIIFEKAKNKLTKNGLLFISELHPFRQYQGTKARFEHENKTIELEVYKHNLSDYWNVAKKLDFNCLQFNEWNSESEENETPRLVTFIFQKH